MSAEADPACLEKIRSILLQGKQPDGLVVSVFGSKPVQARSHFKSFWAACLTAGVLLMPGVSYSHDAYQNAPHGDEAKTQAVNSHHAFHAVAIDLVENGGADLSLVHRELQSLANDILVGDAGSRVVDEVCYIADKIKYPASGRVYFSGSDHPSLGHTEDSAFGPEFSQLRFPGNSHDEIQSHEIGHCVVGGEGNDLVRTILSSALPPHHMKDTELDQYYVFVEELMADVFMLADQSASYDDIERLRGYRLFRGLAGDFEHDSSLYLAGLVNSPFFSELKRAPTVTEAQDIMKVYLPALVSEGKIPTPEDFAVNIIATKMLNTALKTPGDRISGDLVLGALQDMFAKPINESVAQKLLAKTADRKIRLITRHLSRLQDSQPAAKQVLQSFLENCNQIYSTISALDTSSALDYGVRP